MGHMNLKHETRKTQQNILKEFKIHTLVLLFNFTLTPNQILYTLLDAYAKKERKKSK